MPKTLARRPLLALAASFALWSCAPAAPPPATGTPEARRAALDAALRAQVSSGKVDAISALVVRADGTVLYRGHEGTPAPGDDSLFRLASMTKPVTSVAVMQLVERGQLRLEDPVGRWLPEFRNLRVVAEGGRTVPARRQPTVADLLRHTSGLSYNFLNLPGVVDAYRRLGVDDGLAAPDRALRDNMSRLSRAPLAVQPGEAWRYGLSTDVLGAIVERASGMPLDRYVAREIAEPLRMTSFAFRVPDTGRARIVRAAYPAEGGALRPMASPQVVPYPFSGGTWTADPDRAFSANAYPSGGAGATATMADYGRFARMLLNGGELDGARILRPETVALMTRDQTGGMEVNLRGPGNGFGYGFAVVTDPAAAKTLQPAGTFGWGGIYGTGFWVDPVNRLVILVMTQTAVNGGPAGGAVREAVYESLR